MTTYIYKLVGSNAKVCKNIKLILEKMWFHLFTGNLSIVNSLFHRELNPSGGSYSRNPFTTKPTQR